MLVAGVAAVLLLMGSAPAVPSAAPAALRRALHAASVQIDPPGCSGVLAENDQIVVAARPGASAAPVVAVVAAVVGLVRGGARSHIATPADTLLRLVDRVLERDDVRMTRARIHAGRAPLTGRSSRVAMPRRRIFA